MKKIAIIGGTALKDLFATAADVETLTFHSDFGAPSANLAVSSVCGVQVVFLPRHGARGDIAPHLINYRANIAVLKQLEVEGIFAVNSVGGLTGSMSPGTLAVPDQIIDYSFGRESSFFDGRSGALKHVDFTQPYSGKLRTALLKGAENAGIRCVDHGVYACTQGPRLETAAEIQRCIRDGCDLVGMTGMPEAVLARELEIDYASLCLVVNWGAGLTEEPISMQAIVETARAGAVRLQSTLMAAVELLI